MNTKLLLLFFLVFLALGINSVNSSTFEDYQQIAGSMHTHSTWGDGSASIEQLVDSSEQNGLSTLGMTDHVWMQFTECVAIAGIKLCDGGGSPIGIKGKEKDYVNKINSLNKNDFSVIPGVETAPYFHLTENILGKKIYINDLHKHLTVFFPGYFSNLRSRDYGYKLEDNIKSFTTLYLGGLNGLNIPFDKAYVSSGLYPSPRVKQIVSDWISPYKKNEDYFGALADKWNLIPKIAYQTVIDEGNDKGGLIFWAHPESKSNQEKDMNKCKSGVCLFENTNPYPEELLKTYDYTGFEALNGGQWSEEIIKPGGYWDQVLNEYLKGKRKKPVWAVAGTDSHGNSVGGSETVFLVNENYQDKIFAAMRYGLMFVRDSAEFKLNDFSIGCNGLTATLGQEMFCNEAPKIHISLDSPVNIKQIKLIRNGQLIKTFEPQSKILIFNNDSWCFTFETNFDDAQAETYSYYRLDAIDDNGKRILSNPIFVIKNVVSISTDKSSYAPGESIGITIKANNPTDKLLEFSFSSACQTKYYIDDYDSSKSKMCGFAITSVKLKPGETKTWTYTHKNESFELQQGVHKVIGEIIDYGKAETTITVQEPINMSELPFLAIPLLIGILIFLVLKKRKHNRHSLH